MASRHQAGRGRGRRGGLSRSGGVNIGEASVSSPARRRTARPDKLADGEATSAAPLVPPRPTLATLREAAAGCRACDLWERGTQTVFGEGARAADVVFVGEQPGDREDVEGHPFVGPAGRLLEKAIEAAGLDRVARGSTPSWR